VRRGLFPHVFAQVVPAGLVHQTEDTRRAKSGSETGGSADPGDVNQLLRAELE
jgi:hypothetical protein